MKRILVLMFIGLLLVNCGSKRRVTGRESPREKEKTGHLNLMNFP